MNELTKLKLISLLTKSGFGLIEIDLYELKDPLFNISIQLSNNVHIIVSLFGEDKIWRMSRMLSEAEIEGLMHWGLVENTIAGIASTLFTKYVADKLKSKSIEL